MTWKKRDRIEAIFNGEQPDRIPIYDLLFHDEAIEYYAGRKLDSYDDLDTVCAAVSECLDMTRDIRTPSPVRDYTAVNGFRMHDERWSSWIISRPFDHDEKRLLQFIRDDIDRLRDKKSFSRSEITEYREGVERIKNLTGDSVVIHLCPNINVNYCFNTVGMETFCLLLYDEPELVREWMKAAEDYDILRTDTFASFEDAPVSLLYADVAQKGNLIFPKDFLVEYMMPHIVKVCDLLHSHGMKVIFHSDGNIMSILSELEMAGVDGLNPIETSAGMDIKAIRETFGRRFILCGGIDASELLPLGSVDDVIRATNELIRQAGSDFGLCLGSSTEISNGIPLENIRAMIETCREYGRYPLSLC